jgi:hypothetical protein
MKLLFAIAVLAALAPACAQAEQPDLNMDDLRTFSRRFCMKTGACTQALHPNIEDRRDRDTSMLVPHALMQWPQLPATQAGVGSGTLPAGKVFVPYAYRPAIPGIAIDLDAQGVVTDHD